MPRQQSYLLGGGGGGTGSGASNGNSDGYHHHHHHHHEQQPRDRPVLKQAKSALAYSSSSAAANSSMSPRPKPTKSSFSMSEAAGGRLGTGVGGLGFFRGRGGVESLPLTRPHSPDNGTDDQHHNGSRHKMRAAVSGRDGVLPDWSRSTPSPSTSFNNNSNNTLPSPRKRTNSHSSNQHNQNNHGGDPQGMSCSLRDNMEAGHHNGHHLDYDSGGEDDQRYPRRSSTNSPRHANHHLINDPQQLYSVHVHHVEPDTTRALRKRNPRDGDYQYQYQLPNNNSSNSSSRQQSQHRQPNRATSNNSNSGGGGKHGGSSGRPHNRLMRLDSKTFRTVFKWNLTQVLQGAIFLLVTFLLYDSHHKANLIATRLKDFKSEEAMLFLHLQKIEQQSIQLHEALQRLDTAHSNSNNNNNNNNMVTNRKTTTELVRTKEGGSFVANDKHTQQQHQPNILIDSALIQKQTQQLMQMEEELSHEVRTLQTRIQHSAVRSIVHEYGEGPVQVIWEVVVPEDGTIRKVSILLWHDTPHAAWTWLEQISRKLWDGAQIHLGNNRIMTVEMDGDKSNNAAATQSESRLDFIERSQQSHEAWTVGLAEPPSQGGDANGNGGGLQVFINLQDNTEFSKHNVCVGKVFDGFDVLHKMVEQSRQMQGAERATGGAPPITIRTARASHLTNRETKGLI